MSTNITQLLQRARTGDRTALDQLAPLVYSELHRLADSQLRKERSDHTLQPTSLVNEAYIRLFGSGTGPQFADRSHFLGVAARVMRQVLVDHARSRSAQKRGSGLRVTMEDHLASAAPPMADLLSIDQALDRLEGEDARLARLIEMRFFAGMTAEETAEVLSESVHTVRHNLRYAQAWLRRELESIQR